MSNKRLMRGYLFIFIFGLFALNVGQTFSSSNSPFLIILIFGLVMTAISFFNQARIFVVDKAITIYALFTAFVFASGLWAERSDLAKTGFFVVLLTLVIIIVFYMVLREACLDIYDLFGYFAWAALCCYLYLVARYGISATWAIRDENFAGAALYNANSVGKLYCIGAIFSYEKYKNCDRNKRIYLYITLVLALLTLLSGSKTNLLFAGLYIILKLYIDRRTSGGKAFLILLIPVIVCVAYMLLMNVPILYEIIGHRLEEVFNFFGGNGEKYSSTWYRMSMYQNGIEAFLKKPFFGYGMSNAALHNRFEYAYQDGVYLHSNYLELLVDLGIIGTLIYYSIYIYSLKWNLRLSKEGDSVSKVFIALIIAFLVTDISAVSYLSRPSIMVIMLACFYAKNHLSKQR